MVEKDCCTIAHRKGVCVCECETILTDWTSTQKNGSRMPFLNIMFAFVIYFLLFFFCFVALPHPHSGAHFDIFIIHKIQYYYAFCQVFFCRFSFFFHIFYCIFSSERISMAHLKFNVYFCHSQSSLCNLTVRTLCVVFAL